MANIIVSVAQSNVTVDEANSNVAVTTTLSNVTVGDAFTTSNTVIRSALSATDAGGDGSFAYDNSTGVFTYTGPSASEVRAHLSGTSPITYSSGTGAIGIDSAAVFSGKTTDDLAEGSNNLYFTNTRADARVNAVLPNTGSLSEGTNLYFTTARANSAIGAYTGNLTAVNTTGNITTTANVSGAYILGDGSQLTGIDELTNAQAQAFIEANGLDMTSAITSNSNVTTTGNLSVGNLYVTTVGQVDTQNLNVRRDLVIVDDQYANLTVGGYGSWENRGQRLHIHGALSGAGELLLGDSGNIALAKTRLYGNGAIYNDSFIESGGNISSSMALKSTGGTGLIITGNATIGGNLDVTGNINSETVVDLFVEDRNITMQYGAVGTPVNDSHIFVDRGSAANVYLQWRESADQWMFTNDGTQDFAIPTSTTLLLEGTNLYYTDARADARVNLQTGTNLDLSSKSTSDLTEGTNLYFTGARARGNISVGTPASASSGGALAYNSGTGVFTFTPADIQTDSEVRALISTTTAAASGGGSLAYDNGTGVFTFAPADSVTTATNATNVNITDDTSTDAAHYVTLSPTTSGNNALEVSSSKLSFNPSSGILQTDHISSDSGQPLQLKGQTNGIQVDKTISSAESRIFDADTTGYGVASADLGAFSTNTSCPGFLTGLFITAGSNTGTSYDLTATTPGGPFGLYAQKEGANNAYTSMFGSSSLQNAVEVGLGTNAKTSGWSQFSLTDSSSAAAFPADTYVVSIVGNTVTFSQNALKSYGAGAFFILAPGYASSTHADLRFRISRDTANASLPFQSIEPWMSKYVGPETFSNTTLDYASYTISGTTIDAGNVVTRNSIDINSNPDSAIRTQRALLIGANATPDLLSVGTTDVLPGTTTLGITVEQDGVTDFGGANTTPQMKFMMNQYTDNSIGRFTSYPPWTEFLGQSGNATVDLQYLGAPNFNYKLIGGSKDAKVTTKTSDVIGRLTFNNVIPGVVSGADIFHPPASLTVRSPGSGAQANNTVGNADVHLQSTYSTSFRNGANVAGGTIPRTFLSSSEGNTVIAAKTDGKVTLRPVRDYGDEGADTTYVENRFPHELHEYHEFLGAGFLSSKTGTLVEIQSKSGETGGSSNFNYDSKGNATLRISTHEANNAVKAQWDITNEQSTGNLVIAKGGVDLVDITADTAIFTQTIGSPSATDTGAVINFVKPTIFGSPTTAITANITNDLTNAKLGIVQKIYHNKSTEPSFPAGWVKLGTTDYQGSARNIIYCEWCEGTRVEYWYVQET